MSASYSYIQPGVTDAVPSLCEWFAPRRVLLRSSFWCYNLKGPSRRVSPCWKVAESISKRKIVSGVLEQEHAPVQKPTNVDALAQR